MNFSSQSEIFHIDTQGDENLYGVTGYGGGVTCAKKVKSKEVSSAVSISYSSMRDLMMFFLFSFSGLIRYGSFFAIKLSPMELLILP
jgi:hypothetical protein